MLAVLGQRLVQSVLILFGVAAITFVLLYALPADPARMLAGRSATAQTVENIRRELGLDQPLPVQFAQYVGGLVQGDLGRSYAQKTEVVTLIAARLPATADTDTGAAGALATGIPIPAGFAYSNAFTVPTGSELITSLVAASVSAKATIFGCWNPPAKSNAATPATYGDAIEVPLSTAVAVSPVNQAALIADPGAARSTQDPKLL